MEVVEPMESMMEKDTGRWYTLSSNCGEWITRSR